MRYLEKLHPESNLSTPIFLYCGNEADIVEFYANSGFLTDTLYSEYKARVIFVEHRFFGKSMPFGNNSYENTNLQLLTVEQAMADYV